MTNVIIIATTKLMLIKKHLSMVDMGTWYSFVNLL